MATNLNPIIYVGNGQSGVWADPLNWAGGHVPGASSTALITKSALLNGPIEVSTLMLIGSETVNVNGQIKTDSTNVCESFMVCQQSTVDFNAGSSLLSAGGFECGVNGVGVVNLAGAAGSVAAASLSAVTMKIGQFVQGTGTVNVGGVLNVTGGAYVGYEGSGTLNMTGAGHGNFQGLALGEMSGGVGSMNLSGTSAAAVAGYLTVGTSAAGAPGGTGTMTVGGSATVTVTDSATVGFGSSIVMAGGTLSVGAGAMGVQIRAGGSMTGHGTVSSAVHGVTDSGTLASAGGTLVVNGNLSGMGKVQVGAGSTLDLNSSKIGVASIAFMGPTGTLGLTPGEYGSFTITGFSGSDQLAMGGIDQASWNGVSHMLTLSEHGTVVNRLTLTGVASNAVFHVAGADTAGAVVSLGSVSVPSMLPAFHH